MPRGPVLDQAIAEEDRVPCKPGPQIAQEPHRFRPGTCGGHVQTLAQLLHFHPPTGATLSGGSPVCGDTNEGGQGGSSAQACDKPTPQESNQTFIKRVVGGPGDRIRIINGHVIRNGVPEKDSYIEPCGSGSDCNFPKTIVIPPGDYFMMGDNRGASDDSRFWGPVPDKWVIGVAFFTYWPPDRIGFL